MDKIISNAITHYIYIKTTNQIGVIVEKRPSGYRIKNIGIVPYSECRETTSSELLEWKKSKL
jgi:hypothetical protein